MHNKEFVVGLCEGRHEIPGVREYIFPKDFFTGSDDMFDFGRMQDRIHEVLKEESVVTLYVTGFTPALIEVVNYCNSNLIELRLMHFNRDENSYVAQPVNTRFWITELREGGYVA